MTVIFLLVIVGVIVAAGFLLAFVWSVKSGQYDDMTSPAVRILFDDALPGKADQDKDHPQLKKNRKHHLRIIH